MLRKLIVTSAALAALSTATATGALAMHGHWGGSHRGVAGVIRTTISHSTTASRPATTHSSFGTTGISPSSARRSRSATSASWSGGCGPHGAGIGAGSGCAIDQAAGKFRPAANEGSPAGIPS